MADNNPILLEIDLDSTTRTNEAIQIFKQHHNTIYDFTFSSKKNEMFSTNNNNQNTNIVQENLCKFLNFLASTEVITNNPIKQCSNFTFENQFIGLNEAKLIVAIINSSNCILPTISFNYGVSEDAIEYLVYNCGKNKKCNYHYYFNNKLRKTGPRSQSLTICGKAITCSHVKCLDQALTKSLLLYELQLSETNISNDGAKSLADALCKNTKNIIMSLDLHNNKITSLGAQALADMLCQNTSCLETFNLSHNDIGNDGVIALAKALHVNSSLQKLSLRKVGCGNEGLIELANALLYNNTLQELDLGYNKLDREDLEGMEALGMALKVNSTLLEVELDMCLESHADCGDMIGKFVKCLDGKKSKLMVDLESNYQNDFTEEAINCLTTCNAPLLSLNLGFNNLKPIHIHMISRAIQQGRFNIQGLKFDDSDMDDDCIIDFFNVLVEKKDTTSCSLIDLSLEFIEGLTSVGAQHIVDNLSSTKLQRLFMSEIPIGNDGVKKIASFLNDTDLVGLGLDNVGMGDSGLIALSDALKTNTKLTVLDIYRNSNVTNNVGKYALLETLRDYNRTLNEICLKKGDDNDDGVYDMINFYATLNKIQRDKLCDPDLIAVSLFPFIFEIHCKNPSVVYWILQSCPRLYIK